MKVEPLKGLTILNTRAQHQAGPLTKALKNNGATVIEIPLIKLQYPDDTTDLDEAISRLQLYDWIVFTSVNSVRFFMAYLEKKSLSLQIIQQLKIAAVGEKTARNIEKQGYAVRTFPSVYDADHLAEQLVKYVKKHERILYPKSRLSREVLPKVLRENGFQIDDPILYETIFSEDNKETLNELIKKRKIDMITFTSPSTVHSFFRQLYVNLTKEVKSSISFAVIGPVTGDALATYGVKEMVVPKVYTIEGLVDEIVKTFQS